MVMKVVEKLEDFLIFVSLRNWKVNYNLPLYKNSNMTDILDLLGNFVGLTLWDGDLIGIILLGLPTLLETIKV